ncbi:hypothetical protein ACFFRR_000250 [Megaselia abdita]
MNIHRNNTGRKVLWAFPGLNTQWNQMGKDLLKIKVFKQTILRCHEILVQRGMNLLEIITSEDPTIFDHVQHPFVAICSVQLGMVNILKALGIEPDYIIGHSFGQVVSGYADGGLTEEQAILVAYYYGFVCLGDDKINGLMCNISLGFKELQPLLPDDVFPACHNAWNSCTVSGPVDSIIKFADDMMKKGIVAHILNTSRIGFHTPFTYHLKPILLDHLKKVLPSPIRRSPKWISSSVPVERWEQDAKFCSGEYYIGNYCDPVVFEENCKCIPDNLLVIEVGFGVLQGILAENFPNSRLFKMGKFKHLDGVTFLKTTLEGLKDIGFDLDIDILGI